MGMALLLFPLSVVAAAPIVSSLSPADGATGVSVATAALSLQFDQVVQGGAGNITLKRSSDDSIIEAIAVTSAQVTGSGTDTITISLSAPINEYNASFYVQIAATAFRNGAGETYAGIADTTTWNFSTAALAAPALSSLTPADDATGVGAATTTLTIQFDKVVQGSAGNITLKRSSNNSVVESIAGNSGQVSGSGTDTITVTLSSQLGEYARDFYAQIDNTAFHNIAGVFFAGIADTTTWNFTTETAPSPTGGGSGRNYRVTVLRPLQTILNSTASDLGTVELYSEATPVLEEQEQITEQENMLAEEEPEPEEEAEELVEVPEEQKEPEILTEPEEPLITVTEPPYRFKRRTCQRVAKRFSTNRIMLQRVNSRLDNRFGFTCTANGLPR